MKAGKRNRAKLIDFLGNPENDIPGRSEYAVTILGYKRARTLYRYFTPQDLDVIENEALEVRKQRGAARRARVYDALYKQALEGNVAAVKEFLDRMEGKVADKLIAKHKHKVSTLAIKGVTPGE